MPGKGTTVRPEIAEFNNAASDFEYNFGVAMGLETGNLYGFKGGSIIPGGEADQKLFKDKMIEIGSQKTFDALITAKEGNPGNADQVALLKKIKGHTDVAKSMHNLMVKDPEALNEIKKVLGQSADSDGVNTQDVSNMLDNPQARGALIQIMDKVSDGSKFTSGPDKGQDITSAHAIDLINDYKKEGIPGAIKGMGHMGIEINPLESMFASMNINGLSDIMNILNNPGKLIETMLQSNPALAQSDLFMGMFVPLIEGLGPIMGGMGQDLQAWGQEVQKSVQNSAGEVRGKYSHVKENPSFQANADGKVGNLSLDDFNEKFTNAMEGRGRDINNPEHVRAALIEVDPQIADEIEAIEGNPTLSNKFDVSVKTGSTFEQVKESLGRFHQELQDHGQVQRSTNTLGMGT